MGRLSGIMIMCSRRLWKRGEWMWVGGFAWGEDGLVKLGEDVIGVVFCSYGKYAGSCISSRYAFVHLRNIQCRLVRGTKCTGTLPYAVV